MVRVCPGLQCFFAGAATRYTLTHGRGAIRAGTRIWGKVRGEDGRTGSRRGSRGDSGSFAGAILADTSQQRPLWTHCLSAGHANSAEAR